MTSRRSTSANATTTTSTAAAAAATTTTTTTASQSTDHLEQLFDDSDIVTDAQAAELIQRTPINSTATSAFFITGVVAYVENLFTY